jgi:hypothetical protein
MGTSGPDVTFHHSLKSVHLGLAPISINRCAQIFICGRDGNERWSILYRPTFVSGGLTPSRGSTRQLVRGEARLALRHHLSARPRAGARVSSGHRDAGATGTTMLSVAAHLRHANVRRSKPGLSGSRSERIIGDSQSAQNGRSLVALPRKNEGMERLSITLPLDEAGARPLSVTDSCRDGAVMTQHDISGRDSLVRIAHFQRFRAATN